MLEEMENFMRGLWDEGDEGWFGRSAPTLDISETDSKIEAKVDLPGVDPKDIDIQLHGNTLTVRGQRKEEKEEKGKTYHRVERRHGSFSRTINLPCPVQEDEIAAEYQEGVLTITLPKTEESKAKKITVKS
jgi:HSP20 family protein